MEQGLPKIPDCLQDKTYDDTNKEMIYPTLAKVYLALAIRENRSHIYLKRVYTEVMQGFMSTNSEEFKDIPYTKAYDRLGEVPVR